MVDFEAAVMVVAEGAAVKAVERFGWEWQCDQRASGAWRVAGPMVNPSVGFKLGWGRALRLFCVPFMSGSLGIGSNRVGAAFIGVS